MSNLFVYLIQIYIILLRTEFIHGIYNSNLEQYIHSSFQQNEEIGQISNLLDKDTLNDFLVIDKESVKISSVYHLLPSGPTDLLYYFESARISLQASIEVPLALGLHRPQNIEEPLPRSVAAASSQLYLEEEFFISRFISYSVNMIGFPLYHTFLGACIFYTFRSLRNQLVLSSSLPSIHSVASLTVQLPEIESSEFLIACKSYMTNISKRPSRYVPPKFIDTLCKQLPLCVNDGELQNSVRIMRETLAVNLVDVDLLDTPTRLNFMKKLQRKFHRKPLTTSYLQLLRLTIKMDYIMNSLYINKVTEVYDLSKESIFKDLMEIFDKPTDTINKNTNICEYNLKNFINKHKLLPKSFEKENLSILVNSICIFSLQAINSILVPLPPTPISLKYLMYLHEYLELPLKMIAKAQCTFYLSSSYTGIYPLFPQATQLALLLGSLGTENSIAFVSQCKTLLPNYINLRNNVFKNKVEMNSDTLIKDSSELCKAIYMCFTSLFVISPSDTMILILSSVASPQSFHYNQILSRYKFIGTKLSYNEEFSEINDKNSTIIREVLSPTEVLQELIKTHDPNLVLKSQLLYSYLYRLVLLITNSVDVSEYQKDQINISMPYKYILNNNNPISLIFKPSEVIEIIKNSFTASDCASAIVKGRTEFSTVFPTLATFCFHVMFDSYPMEFSKKPYLHKLVISAVNDFGFSLDLVIRLHCYVASSLIIMGVHPNIQILLEYVIDNPNEDLKKLSNISDLESKILIYGARKEIELCKHKVPLYSALLSTLVWEHSDVYCKYVSLCLNDIYHLKLLDFSIRSYTRGLTSEKFWRSNVLSVIQAVKEEIIYNSRTDIINLEAKYPVTYMVTLQALKFIRLIQRSSYSKEMSIKDIIIIFKYIYSDYNTLPCISSSAFTGTHFKVFNQDTSYISGKNTEDKYGNTPKMQYKTNIGLRSTGNYELMLENDSCLVKKCYEILYKSYEVYGELSDTSIKGICISTFEFIHLNLPVPPINRNALFINYLVNYLFIPINYIPPLLCSFKIFNAMASSTYLMPAFEPITNFILHLIALRGGLISLDGENSLEHCRISALISGIVDTSNDSIFPSDIVENEVLSNCPIQLRKLDMLCRVINQQCINKSGLTTTIKNYIEKKTRYKFIFESSINSIQSKKKTDSFSSIRYKIEKIFESKITRGHKINYKGNSLHIVGIRILEGIRIYGILHDSFIKLAIHDKSQLISTSRTKSTENQKYFEDDISRKTKINSDFVEDNFSGLYSGNSPFITMENYESTSMITLDTAILLVYEMNLNINQLLGDSQEVQVPLCNRHPLIVPECIKVLKEKLPKSFSSTEIESVCIITFARFKQY
ncbi:uncharacterized protein CMU_021760 [Cryptosporidium muris RN66]|uniref:Uncharacterized protein n=1 Tax=Cryptosporidium muris (strain RN66) TaxID=441375 RepID=B6AJM1_CRYMR|nr:uncharacterized protein CMU_021760 [Cryptosporidium muris RN66]EEA08412.1 hypothetical protein, conserved [Cryptosporidium muris RN66]|eukprot:XP_002142761.1 hypothetical protein [Cryptosporidium muris RN66]